MIVYVILQTMLKGEGKSYPIHILLNYWEIQSSCFAEQLEEFTDDGVQRVTTFVPWQFFESDISHSLLRFVQRAKEKDISVSVVFSPELGVHSNASGLPKDLFSREGVLATNPKGEPFRIHLPPRAFCLPSLHSDGFSKRYFSYLSRVNVFLSDLERSHQKLLKHLTVWLTGSFWKYYRDPGLSSFSPFLGQAGDRCRMSGEVYRKCLNDFFNDREFADPDPMAASVWRTRDYDSTNLLWFQQQSEDVFRYRSEQVVGRGSIGVPLGHMELFTPEGDPNVFYSELLRTLGGGAGDFSRFSRILDEYASRESARDSKRIAPMVHWSGLGGFSKLSRQEKQFLILKSLLLFGSRGGGVFLHHHEWMGLSKAFRSKMGLIADTLSKKKLRLRNKAFYLVPHLWSDGGDIWDAFRALLGAESRVIASLDYVFSDKESFLLVVDPRTILTKDHITRIFKWARKGRVACIPRGTLYSKSAEVELKKQIRRQESIKIDLGISYEVFAVGNGQVLLYETPENLQVRGEMKNAWKRFAQSVRSVARLPEPIQSSDARLSLIPLEKSLGEGRGMGLFVLNPTAHSVMVDLHFPNPVHVSDLALRMGTKLKPETAKKEKPLARVHLEVPPFGILPLSVDGLYEDTKEKHDALMLEEFSGASAFDSAQSELPGFSDEGDPWK